MTSLIDRSQEIQGALAIGLPQGGGAISGSRSQTDVERLYELRNTMRRFDGEIDAQFRSVTSSCKAFSRCMEKNEYDEARCGQTLSRWESAEQEFSALAIELRRLENEANQSTPPPPPPRIRDSEKRCCDTLNNIFTDCCDTHE
ncbi:MAG: hypothetical protein AAF224_07865 [Pseudomonadota bacterium]